MLAKSQKQQLKQLRKKVSTQVAQAKEESKVEKRQVLYGKTNRSFSYTFITIGGMLFQLKDKKLWKH